MNPPLDLNLLPLTTLYSVFSNAGLIRRLLEIARDEDLGFEEPRGDITTRSWRPPRDHATAHLVAREAGVIAGLEALPELLRLFAPKVNAQAHCSDGAAVPAGIRLATLTGPTEQLLALERTMLNLVGRLSGIASLTSRYVSAVGTGTRAKVLDTRKTTPGLRLLEKYAVRCGGGFCHRLGLYDAVLVKDNHLSQVPLEDLARCASEAARRARSDRPLRFVEFEADTMEQVRVLLDVEAGLIDVILLDNMNLESLRRAVAARDARRSGVLLEASGGVRLETIRGIAETGVDRISVGALTHSATSLDLALDFVD